MKKITKQAIKLAQQIGAEYDKIELTDYGFFDAYHDTMLYQKEGAWEEVGEIEYFEEKGEIKHAEGGIKQLMETLAYCKAVVKLQEMTRKLPKAIYC